jgi:ribonuclease P protein component
MLKKSSRLTKRQFDEIMKKGRVAHSSLFLMRFTDNNKDKRISAVAPLKVAKKAVERIRIRRKIYNALESVLKSVSAGTHAALFAKKDISLEDNESLASDIRQLFVKARVL